MRRAGSFWGASFGGATAGAAVALAVSVPFLTANTYYLYLAVTMAITIVVTSGLNVLAGLSGQISLGHAGLYAIGAYSAAIAATRGGLGVWVAVPLGAAITAAVGGLLALAALRVSGPYLAMVTIAFGIIVEGTAVEWVALTGGPGGIFDIPKPTLGGVVLPLGRYYLVTAAAAALALLATRNLARSAWGRALVAVKDSEVAAESLGLSTYRLRVVAFTISAAMAGAGGGLFAFLNGYLSPDSFTLQTSILFLLIVLFGGLGEVAGPVVGTLVLVLLPEVLRGFLEYRLILYGGLLLLSIYFLPGGVVGAVRGRGRTGHTPAAPIARSASDEPLPTDGWTAAAAAEVGTTILRVEGVSVAFGGLVALADVSLSVAVGTIHSLIGPNGAGKTTLVNLMTGFHHPDAGRIELRGMPITRLSPPAIARRGLVRTFQTPQLFGDLTVLENVMVGAAGHRLGSLARALAGGPAESTGRRRAEAVMTVTALEDWADAPARALPFGLRRRLEIARALAAGASTLVLDEPAAGLSLSEIEQLEALLRRLRSTGLTVLLIEHHMELVMALSDEVTVLDEGHVIAAGPAADVQRDARVIEAYLGVTPAP